MKDQKLEIIEQIQDEIDELQSEIDDAEEESSVDKKENSKIIKRKQVELAYLEFVEKLKMLPTLADLAEYGISRNAMREHFTNIAQLHDEMNSTYPEFFKDIYIPADFSPEKSKENLKKIREHIKKSGRFVTFSVEPGVSVREDCLLSLINNNKDTMLIALPLKGDLLRIDRILKKHNITILTEEVNLNTNIKITPLETDPKSIKPTSGLGRIGQRSCTVIYPSTKLYREPIPTDNDKMPHLIITTGALTGSMYYKGNGLKKKTHYVAEHDHEISAISIQIYNENIFFLTEIMFDIDGSYCQVVGKKGAFRFYPMAKPTVEIPENLNPGDLHVVEMSEQYREMLYTLIECTQPKTISIHDANSYMSYNHHNIDDPIVTSLIFESGLWDPRKEFVLIGREFKEILKRSPKSKLYVVESNHDNFIERAAKKGILNTPELRRVYNQVMLALQEGHNVFKWCLDIYGDYSDERVIFLEDNDKHVLKNNFGELALHFHGHIGAKGGKNSASQNNSGIALTHGCANIGHIHGPRIHPGASYGGFGNGGVWYAGTAQCLSGPDLPHYAKKSPHDWMNSMIFTFGSKNGRFLRQMVTMIGGTHSLDYGKPVIKPEKRYYSDKQVAETKVKNKKITFKLY